MIIKQLPLIKLQTSCITCILIVCSKLNKGHAPYNTCDRVILAYLPENSTVRARCGVFSDSPERTGGRREPIACDILPGRQIRTVLWKRAEERSTKTHRHRGQPPPQTLTRISATRRAATHRAKQTRRLPAGVSQTSSPDGECLSAGGGLRERPLPPSAAPPLFLCDEVS